MKYLIFLLIIFEVSCNSKNEIFQIQFDGFYSKQIGIQTVCGIDTNVKVVQYLKFDRNNTVRSFITMKLCIDSVKKIFDENNDLVESGSYKILNDSIFFETKKSNRIRNYKGRFEENGKLKLNINCLPRTRSYNYEFSYQSY